MERKLALWKSLCTGRSQEQEHCICPALWRDMQGAERALQESWAATLDVAFDLGENVTVSLFLQACTLTRKREEGPG